MKFSQFLRFCLCGLTFLLCGTLSFSQFSGTNIIEGQIGQLPNETVEVFPSIYNRTELKYQYKEFTTGLTLEQFYTIYENRSYFDLSQVNIAYKKKKWNINLGNIYETLGRGLLLRSFEIPGSLIEDIGFRSRTYFHRDILGASVKFKSKRVTIKLLRGDLLNNVLPPTFDRKLRRIDLINAIEVNVKYLGKQKMGLRLMNHQMSGLSDDNLTSGSLEGPITKAFNYYVEYASNLSNSDTYAFYSSINGYSGSFSFSIEYKKYNNFVIGAGFNEPPALIKEHTYKVLNRSTHVTNPLNEEGYQLDIFYIFKNGSVLNVNHSRAINDFTNNKDVFQEYFAEFSSSFKKIIDYKVFLDYSNDPFKGQRDRLSGGIYSDIRLNEALRFLPEFEYQRFTRNDIGATNINLSLGLNMNSKIFFSILVEFTDDAFLVKEGQMHRIYLGNAIRFKPDYKNTFQFFFGERQGGPLCSAGVCYEILDFRGMEVRWTTRFSK